MREGDTCLMTMNRIYHPDAVSSSDQHSSIQALFGQSDSDLHLRDRGYIYGLQQFSKYIPKYDLAQITYELGKMLGLLHYAAKNDAYDIEIIMGKENPNPSSMIHFYFIDFDLAEEIQEYNTGTIERMEWALEAVPYFPAYGDELYPYFKRGYMKIATAFGLEDVAIKVMSLYERQS